MSMDTETKRHQEIYSSFVKFLTYATAATAVALALMAIFLV
jgi:hypothetical protein